MYIFMHTNVRYWLFLKRKHANAHTHAHTCSCVYVWCTWPPTSKIMPRFYCSKDEALFLRHRAGRVWRRWKFPFCIPCFLRVQKFLFDIDFSDWYLYLYTVGCVSDHLNVKKVHSNQAVPLPVLPRPFKPCISNIAYHSLMILRRRGSCRVTEPAQSCVCIRHTARKGRAGVLNIQLMLGFVHASCRPHMPGFPSIIVSFSAVGFDFCSSSPSSAFPPFVVVLSYFFFRSRNASKR